MKIKTSKLIGAILDWAVAKCEGYWFGDAGYQSYALYQPHKYGPTMPASRWSPSTDWSQGGPLIEREAICIDLLLTCEWLAVSRRVDSAMLGGPTPLIAAMRCLVASKLGDEVEIPEELAP